jgi:hypothetical protein
VSTATDRLVGQITGQQFSQLSDQGASDITLVRGAAALWGVPFNILWGVYVKETAAGATVHTSSAGAEGPFGSNKPAIQDTQASAWAAGRYLAHLRKQYGSWDQALRHYSGGGYGLRDVQAAARQTPPAKGSADQAVGDFGNVGGDAPSGEDPLSKLSGAIGALLDPHTWIRIFEAVGGAVLILMALKELTGGSLDPIGRVRRAL